MKHSVATKAADLIVDTAKFNEELTYESNPELSFSANDEDKILIQVGFEFDLIDEDSGEITDEGISEDLSVWFDKKTKTASVEHPYCTNKDELAKAVQEYLIAELG